MDLWETLNPHEVGRASLTSHEIYDRRDRTLVQNFVQQFYPGTPSIHFCAKLDGIDTIILMTSDKPISEHPPTKLPFLIIQANICFGIGSAVSDRSEERIHYQYEPKPLPGRSIDAHGSPFVGNIGFYMTDTNNGDRYIITVAHNFVTDDPANPADPTGQGVIDIEKANSLLHAGTIVNQPANGDLKYEITTVKRKIEEMEEDIKVAEAAHRFKARDIYVKMLQDYDHRLKILSSLPIGSAQEFGTLTDFHELIVEDTTLYDYCLVKVKSDRVGENIVDGNHILRITGLNPSSIDSAALTKVGRTTGQTTGEFFPIIATISIHPRFPRRVLEMPLVLASKLVANGAIWCWKGDSGGPVVSGTNAVGIVLGHVVPDPPYQNVQVGVISPLDFLVARINAKFGLNLDLHISSD